MKDAREILRSAFAKANSEEPKLSQEEQEWVTVVVKNAETQKAVLAALLTSLVKKMQSPEQDIRKHKVEMPGGYSGRSFDTNFVTPFLRQHFPRFAMKSGSGWLTRSIEQNHVFNLDFPGKIQNPSVKSAFLRILNDLETNVQDPEPYLILAFTLLIRNVEVSRVVLSVSPDMGQVRIETVIALLRTHFFGGYKGVGASRLPALAIYAVYEQMMNSFSRYADKTLLPPKSHTTSDLKSSSIGDVEVVNADGTFFEAVEVKHRIPITQTLIRDAYDKLSPHPLSRYYLLTTAEPNMKGDPEEIEQLLTAIKTEHGCEVIVNGIMPSLKYYLRLLNDPSAFLVGYTKALQADYTENTDLKEIHLRQWEKLLAGIRASDD